MAPLAPTAPNRDETERQSTTAEERASQTPQSCNRTGGEDEAASSEQLHSVLTAPFLPPIQDSCFSRECSSSMDVEMDVYTCNPRPRSPSMLPPLLPLAAQSIAYEEPSADEPLPRLFSLPRLYLPLAHRTRPPFDPPPPAPIEVITSHAVRREWVDERKEQLHKQRAAQDTLSRWGGARWADNESDSKDSDDGRRRQRGGSRGGGLTMAVQGEQWLADGGGREEAKEGERGGERSCSYPFWPDWIQRDTGSWVSKATPYSMSK